MVHEHRTDVPDWWPPAVARVLREIDEELDSSRTVERALLWRLATHPKMERVCRELKSMRPGSRSRERSADDTDFAMAVLLKLVFHHGCNALLPGNVRSRMSDLESRRLAKGSLRRKKLRFGGGKTAVGAFVNSILVPMRDLFARDPENLGLSVAPARDVDGAGHEGIVITKVDADGPAAEQGFKTGDVIIDVAGKSVSTLNDLRDAVRQVRTDGKRVILMRVKTNSVENQRTVSVQHPDWWVVENHGTVATLASVVMDRRVPADRARRRKRRKNVGKIVKMPRVVP
jgi:hypothetical protein